MHHSPLPHILLAIAAVSASVVDLTNLSNDLQTISATVLPGLKSIATDVWNHPEIGTEEFYAHDRVVGYFNKTVAGQWTVTPHAYGQPTAWALSFENRPNGVQGTLPTIGFMSEYDALLGEGHACGHNLILLNGLAAASQTRQALIKYNIPGRILVVGTPDEENTAGKKRLLDAGAFNGADVWMMAHPTVANAVQPMQGRITALTQTVGPTHADAVRKAYDLLVIVTDLAGKLPGVASSATPVEDVGMFTSNIIQTEIELGVSGSSVAIVNNTILGVKAAKPVYAAVNFTLGTDSNGVTIDFKGPGGHASEGTKGPLSLAIETFRALSTSNPSYTYYLPSNTSHNQLDVTISVRTRYTSDISIVQNAVLSAIQSIPQSISWDVPYLALEVNPYLGDRLLTVMKQSTLNDTNWVISSSAPASTDAGWLQNAKVDNSTKQLLSVDRVVFHPNFGICANPSGAGCPFNHEAAFKDLAATDLAYNKTEKMARALAQIAVELVADPSKMAAAKALVNAA